MNKIIAVDFDGTLAHTDYPTIISPNTQVIEFCKWAKNKGSALILYTCREGEDLEDAVEWCKEHGLIFDAINDNLPDRVAEWGNNCRKIYADLYIDDHNVAMKDIFYFSEVLAKEL